MKHSKGRLTSYDHLKVRNKEVRWVLPSPIILQVPNLRFGFKYREGSMHNSASLAHHCLGFSLSCRVARQVTGMVKFLPGRQAPSLAGTKFSLFLSPAQDSWGALQFLLGHVFSSLIVKERIPCHFPVSLLLPGRLNTVAWNSLW